jgi:hydroxyacylglutathione hydrolase
MPSEIQTINVWQTNFLLKGAGGVNCYLVNTGPVYFLIDTGLHARRAELVQALERAGVKPGNLRLIVITHADFDHTGNAAYLRVKYGTPIATHRGESAAVEASNMALNRKKGPGCLGRVMFSLFSVFTRADRFTPDITVDDGNDLAGYGFDARVLHLPGHSQGSIGILTAGGDLFCGDLLINIDRPSPQTLIDDQADLNASIQRLRGLPVGTVYPGHGRPFRMEQVK